MSRDSVTLNKSKAFAVRIIRLYQYLCNVKKEYVLSKQILRSGTSVGANLSEAVHGISEKDFLAKLFIAKKNVLKLSIGLNFCMKPNTFPMRSLFL